MHRNYPNFIEAYLTYTENHESTVRVRKWCAISALAAACERRLWLNRGFYMLFPNLYTFIIGKSGLIKKSTSTGIAVNLLRELDGFKMMSERLTAGSLIAQLQMSGKKFTHRDQLVNQSALFAYAPELSVFLTEVFGSITELLTTFYDCTPSDSSKPWVYKNVGKGETQVYGPCLNILGASTKAWLQKCIPRSEMEGGFTSRIIFVVENNLPEKLVAWPFVDSDGELRRERLIQDLQAIYSLAGEFTVTPEAKAMFSKWYENHMRKVVPLNNDARMVGYMARKGDTILKLAMIHALACGDNLVIGKEDLKWGNRELDDLEQDWRMAFDGLSAPRIKDLPFDVLSYIRSRIKVPQKQLLEHFGQFFPVEAVGKAVTTLLEMGEIKEFVDSKATFYTFMGADVIAPDKAK